MKRFLYLFLLCVSVSATAQTWLSTAVPGTGWFLQSLGSPAVTYQVRATDWTADRSRLIVRVTPARLTGELGLTGETETGYLYAQGNLAWLIFEDGKERYGCGVPLVQSPLAVFPQGSEGRSVQQGAQGSVNLPQACVLSRMHRNLFVKLEALPQPQARQVWQVSLDGLIQTQFNVIWGAAAAAGQATSGVGYHAETGQAYRVQHQGLPENKGLMVSLTIGGEVLACVSTPQDASGSGYAGMIFRQEEGKAELMPTFQDCSLAVLSP
ncbi:hypothetical protein ACFFLM_22505 [Deinococcus oregonensis]|uniref:DUF4450 domain-containing protein n=1 Tax=Deinococcus oregonensis TaxID=1805970 RepID=A0ABV6B691_9DEIO